MQITSCTSRENCMYQETPGILPATVQSRGWDSGACVWGGRRGQLRARPCQQRHSVQGRLSVARAGFGSLAGRLRPRPVRTPCLLCVLGETLCLLSHGDSVALPCEAFLGAGGGGCEECGGVFGLYKCQGNASRYYSLGGHFW